MNARRIRPLPTVALTLGLVAASSLVVACAKDGPTGPGDSDWECARVAVPMGEVTRCTSQGGNTSTVAKQDAPAPAPGGDALYLRAYGVPGGGGGSSEDDPATSSDEESEPSKSYECVAGSNDEECPPLPPPADSSASEPEECSQVPDLPYCGGEASAPEPEPSDTWSCVEDSTGTKTCESTPKCAKGSRPSKCGACVLEGEPDDCVPPAEGGCWVTGGGFIVEPSLVPGAPADGHDNFGGNAKQMKNGTIQGHWNHVDHGTQNHAKGRPEYIYCRRVDEPGPGQPGGKKGFTMNQIYFGGPAEWRSNDVWSDGYWFDVVAKDHGEPGSQPHPKNGFMVDSYHFTIRKMDDPEKKISGAVVYEVKGGLVGGNIQMHPPNNGHPGFQSPLPPWVSLEP